MFRRVISQSSFAGISMVATLCLSIAAALPVRFQGHRGHVVLAAVHRNLGDPYETKALFAQDVAKAFECKPATLGESPYRDVPTRSPQWEWIHWGLQLGLVVPDSRNEFGAGDPVTWQDVTTGSIRYLRVPLDQGMTPYQWAQRERLYPVAGSPVAGSPSAVQLTSPVTHISVVAFLTRLKSLNDLLKSMPDSWSLRGVEAGLLTRALSNTAKSGFGQRTALLSIRVAAEATSGATKGRSAVLAALNHVQQLRIVTLSAVDGGQKESYVTMTPVGSSTGGTVVREYELGNTLYLDSGDGWHQLTLGPQQQPPMQPQMPDVRLGQICHVTAEHTSAGYVFRGNLQTAGLVDLIQPLIASITIQPHAAATSRAQPTQSPFSALLQRISAKFAVSVTTQRGKPFISQESASLYMDVPPDILFGGASDTFKDIANLRFQETVTASSTYHPTLVLPPSDLRALLKLKASTMSNQNVNPVTPSTGEVSNVS